MRVMLDSNVYDTLFEDNVLLELVGAAIRSGCMTAMTTHIQPAEHDLISWPAKREALLALPVVFVKVRTSGMVWDVSRWEKAEWGDSSGRIEKMMGGNPKHAEDALIAATADAKADLLITNEKRLAGMVERSGFTVPVWRVPQFADWLRSQESAVEKT